MRAPPDRRPVAGRHPILCHSLNRHSLNRHSLNRHSLSGQFAPAGQQPTRRVGCSHLRRPGFTLIETVCMLSLVGALLSLSAVLLNRAYSVHRTTLTAFRELEQLNHWCERFRFDARQAVQVQFDAGIQFLAKDGRTIEYKVEDQRLIRFVHRQAQPLGREAWNAWPVDRAIGSIDSSGRIPLLSCRLEFVNPQPGREPIELWARLPAIELPGPAGVDHAQ